MDKRYEIGNFICEMRQEKGLTQKELGELLGVTNKAVSKWENGAAMPRMEYLHDLSLILGVTEEEIFLGHRIDKNADEEKAKEGYCLPKGESFDSVVKRCSACRHEGKYDGKRPTGIRCKKCGAMLELKPIWIIFIIIIFFLNFSGAIFAEKMICSDLLIGNFYASAYPNMDEVRFYNALYEHFPKIKTIGVLADCAVTFGLLLADFAVLRLLSFLLRKAVTYKIVHYPHIDDGKVVF